MTTSSIPVKLSPTSPYTAPHTPDSQSFVGNNYEIHQLMQGILSDLNPDSYEKHLENLILIAKQDKFSPKEPMFSANEAILNLYELCLYSENKSDNILNGFELGDNLLDQKYDFQLSDDKKEFIINKLIEFSKKEISKHNKKFSELDPKKINLKSFYFLLGLDHLPVVEWQDAMESLSDKNIGRLPSPNFLEIYQKRCADSFNKDEKYIKTAYIDIFFNDNEESIHSKLDKINFVDTPLVCIRIYVEDECLFLVVKMDVPLEKKSDEDKAKIEDTKKTTSQKIKEGIIKLGKPTLIASSSYLEMANNFVSNGDFSLLLKILRISSSEKDISNKNYNVISHRSSYGASKQPFDTTSKQKILSWLADKTRTKKTSLGDEFDCMCKSLGKYLEYCLFRNFPFKT